MAAFIILLTSGPPLSYSALKATMAFYFSFLSIICFLIGVTKFFTWEFKWDPTLSDSNLKIYKAFEQIVSFLWLNAVLKCHTILGKSSISLFVDY